jgi:hypothetical protein
MFEQIRLQSSAILALRRAATLAAARRAARNLTTD